MDRLERVMMQCCMLEITWVCSTSKWSKIIQVHKAPFPSTSQAPQTAARLKRIKAIMAWSILKPLSINTLLSFTAFPEALIRSFQKYVWRRLRCMKDNESHASLIGQSEAIRKHPWILHDPNDVVCVSFLLWHHWFWTYVAQNYCSILVSALCWTPSVLFCRTVYIISRELPN